MRAALVLLALLALGTSDASAAWRWPWDVPHKRHVKHQRHHQPQYRKTAPTDCKRINDAVAYLSKEELDKELARLDKRRRQTIARCRERAR
jgi:hypothetical protein